MKYAINVPNFGDYADPRVTAELAASAEASGWDGFFVWDHINAAAEPSSPLADPWVLLTAVALATRRLRIGTMVTPVARRRPWKLARETVTLDRLSGGRLILGVGLGFPPDAEFAAFAEDADPRRRADKLDEGLTVLTGLWTGESLDFDGDHYTVSGVRFVPTPVQRPRIPVWVAAMYPHRRPLRRAARWDGLVPMHETAMVPTPGQVYEMVSVVASERPADAPPVDVNVPLVVTADRAGELQLVREYRDAGATWIQVGAWTLEHLRERILDGPPGI
jgi:alkanesulfonate monooxygenase SsuD/methylene tetrahydromethanopterin reductase-like flavin-dependent oxidoreductase (luciferase family)